MDLYQFSERLMRMDDAAWLRHANPWSVYTRILCLPLLVAAIWCRIWIGWWALVPIMLVIMWILFNPRAFDPPKHTESWAARGVMGERVFLNRKTIPIPTHHLHMSHLLSAVSGIGLLPLCYGLIVLDVWATLCGLATMMLGKLWFVDRMAWLFDDMSATHLEYRNWKITRGTDRAATIDV